MLESYDQDSLEETGTVVLNDNGLLNMYRLTSSSLPFNLVGATGPLIFDATTHKRNQLPFTWAIGVE